MTAPAMATTSRQRNTRPKTSRRLEDDETGKPLVELEYENFVLFLHRDPHLGSVVILEDDFANDIKELDIDGLGGIIDRSTWQRLKLLVASGLVDKLLQQA